MMIDLSAHGVLYVPGSESHFRIESEPGVHRIVYVAPKVTNKGKRWMKTQTIYESDSLADISARYEAACGEATVADAIRVMRQNGETTALTGVFKRKYPELLEGEDWLRRLPEQDRRAFARFGFEQSGHGLVGGIVRAATATRNDDGTFAKESE